MGWYLGHKGLLAPPPPPSVPMSPVFAHFSKFSMYAWGKKRKLLVFTAVYVCVKAKLTLVSFFFNFFFAPFPKKNISMDGRLQSLRLAIIHAT